VRERHAGAAHEQGGAGEQGSASGAGARGGRADHRWVAAADGWRAASVPAMLP
jgi:hypothetical protein